MQVFPVGLTLKLYISAPNQGVFCCHKENIEETWCTPQKCTGKYLNPDPNRETTCKVPDLQTFCGNNGCREMFKLAVSKKIQMLYLQVPRKFFRLSVGNFKIFLKRKKKGCISLLTYILGN